MDDAVPDPADLLGRAARSAGIRVGVAESLTSGLLAGRVGAGEDAAEWFAGGIVAYHLQTKRGLLGVPDDVDPCSAACAEQMARAARELLGADVTVSTTGIGGPDPQDGHAPGTVYLGWATATATGHVRHVFPGAPEEVLERTVGEALGILQHLLTELS